MLKAVKVVVSLGAVAVGLQTIVAAGAMVYMLFPWTGATEAVNSVSHAVLSAGLATAALAATACWLEKASSRVTR